jgi:hypothetical protein
LRDVRDAIVRRGGLDVVHVLEVRRHEHVDGGVTAALPLTKFEGRNSKLETITERRKLESPKGPV